MARSKSTMVWNGLSEYIEELKRLPDECKGETAKLVEASVNRAFVTIAQVYEAHRLTGTLRRRLTIRPIAGGLELKSGSPIAWLFDNGSQARYYRTVNGKKHLTGKMWGKTPPTHIFARTIGKEKRTLARQYRDMLRRLGASAVTETVDA